MKAKRHYDIVYLTNTPSFYKLKLMDEVARRGVKVLLVFYGYGSEAVNKDLSNGSGWAFDFHFLHEGDAAFRSKWRTFRRLRKLMNDIDARKVIFSGWLAPEYNLYAMMSPRRRNVMVVESTIAESAVTGVKAWVKRKVVGRMSYALPCGKAHLELIKALGYKGDYRFTGSVGIINKPCVRPVKATASAIDDKNLRCLYVGRLIDCKNLEWLVAQFNESGRALTIAGSGELEDRLKSSAKSNIYFNGFVNNEQLGGLYSSHDLFILPSKSETWGLVVDEALWHGLPVIVSDMVGSGNELVADTGAGRIFRLGDSAGFEECLRDIAANYAAYVDKVNAIDFTVRDAAQVSAYTALVCRKR